MSAIDPRAWLETLREHPRVFGALVVALAIAFGPSLVWRALPSKTVEVVIVDKTVPFPKYREHAAVPWLLHAAKLRSRSGAFLSPETSYVGFDPKARAGHDLTAEHLAGADALVITDTYGVYRGDYERPGDEAALERSPKIYGGMSDAEAALVEGFTSKGGLVLGEFNTFASPTEDAARARLERVFGVRWTKWVVRYWPDLQDANEVPKWVGRIWERLMNRPFDLTGAGLVFVREDQDMLVLRAGEDLEGDVLVQERTPAGAAFDLPKRGGFWFWMDIVEATDADVLHEHVPAVTSKGAAMLAAHGLPKRFPALTKRHDAWYFAGDFVDTAADLGDPERAGLLTWRSYMNGFGGAVSEDRSFWSFYAPIFLRVVGSRAR